MTSSSHRDTESADAFASLAIPGYDVASATARDAAMFQPPFALKYHQKRLRGIAYA